MTLTCLLMIAVSGNPGRSTGFLTCGFYGDILAWQIRSSGHSRVSSVVHESSGPHDHPSVSSIVGSAGFLQSNNRSYIVSSAGVKEVPARPGIYVGSKGGWPVLFSRGLLHYWSNGSWLAKALSPRGDLQLLAPVGPNRYLYVIGDGVDRSKIYVGPFGAAKRLICRVDGTLSSGQFGILPVSPVGAKAKLIVFEHANLGKSILVLVDRHSLRCHLVYEKLGLLGACPFGRGAVAAVSTEPNVLDSFVRAAKARTTLYRLDTGGRLTAIAHVQGEFLPLRTLSRTRILGVEIVPHGGSDLDVLDLGLSALRRIDGGIGSICFIPGSR